MNKTASCHYLAETIEEVTNLKILELYRGNCTMAEARCHDHELTDLSARIIEAISEVPEPDEYEAWLQEKKFQLIGLNMPATEVTEPGIYTETPPTEQDTPRDSPSNPAETHDLPGAPISGDAPALFVYDVRQQSDSNETPVTADQPQAEKPGVETVPESAVCDAGQGTTEKPKAAGKPTKKEIIDLERRLRIFKNRNKLTIEGLSEMAGLSNFTISAIFRKDNVSRETYNKVEAGMISYRPGKGKSSGQEADKPKVNGSGRGPGEYLRLKLLTWLNQEHLGLSQASSRLMVQESALRKITIDGEIPHPNVMRQLCKYVPALEAECAMLMAAADRRDH